MSPDLTFLINSCDKYEDAWYPFFECLWHFAGELPYPIVLNTESKSFSSPHYNIVCVQQPFTLYHTWSKRLLHVLDSVYTDFVFFLLDDYFLENTLDKDRLELVVSYLKTHSEVAIVDVSPHWAATAEEAANNKIIFADTPNDFFVRDKSSFNITCTPGIWRVSALKQILRPHEDVWDFEIYSGIRAKKLGWKVVRFNTKTPGIYEYNYQIWSGMGITAGHWLPNNKPFFENLGIKVNYERLGIMNVTTVDEIRKLNRRNPLTLLKKIPRKLRKKLTRRLSLK